MIISKFFQQDIATSIDLLVIVDYYLANKNGNQLKGFKSYFTLTKILSLESFLKLAPNLSEK